MRARRCQSVLLWLGIRSFLTDDADSCLMSFKTVTIKVEKIGDKRGQCLRLWWSHDMSGFIPHHMFWLDVCCWRRRPAAVSGISHCWAMSRGQFTKCPKHRWAVTDHEVSVLLTIFSWEIQMRCWSHFEGAAAKFTPPDAFNVRWPFLFYTCVSVSVRLQSLLSILSLRRFLTI